MGAGGVRGDLRPHHQRGRGDARPEVHAEEPGPESARILGASRVVFLRHGDCELVPTLALRKELVRRIRRHRPEVVLCNDPQALFFGDRYINHPDHLAAGKVALEAVFPSAEMELLWPGAGPVHKVHAVYVSSTVAPDTWIDVAETIDAKIAALSAHRSQLGDRDMAPYLLERASEEARRAPKPARGKGPRRPKLAEAFRVMKLLREEK
jgi:LmbE family N-acetylglucosaminyl deacetylase